MQKKEWGKGEGEWEGRRSSLGKNVSLSLWSCALSPFQQWQISTLLLSHTSPPHIFPIVLRAQSVCLHRSLLLIRCILDRVLPHLFLWGFETKVKMIIADTLLCCICVVGTQWILMLGEMTWLVSLVDRLWPGFHLAEFWVLFSSAEHAPASALRPRGERSAVVSSGRPCSIIIWD